MDPLLELWLWESWCQDLQDENDFAKAYAILNGSFTNPDAAHAMIKADRPKYTSSDKEFEETTQMLIAEREKDKGETSKKRKRRRHRKRVIG